MVPIPVTLYLHNGTLNYCYLYCNEHIFYTCAVARIPLYSNIQNNNTAKLQRRSRNFIKFQWQRGLNNAIEVSFCHKK